jgi:hypothetical protein
VIEGGALSSNLHTAKKKKAHLPEGGDSSMTLGAQAHPREFCFCFVFETAFHYISQTGLELSV